MAEVTNVRVALRCRPLNKKELSEGDASVFRKEGNTAKLEDESFAFDYVYDDKSTQEEVFRDVGRPVVKAAFDGFNSTVFAYGQTGSGKSWSMSGDMTSSEFKGLIPRINEALFAQIAQEKEASKTRNFLVQVSYFEIYNEIIYDLLDPSPRKDKEKSGGLQIKEHPVLGIHVKGLQQLVATDAAKVAELMELGAKNRTVGATQMNAESSRSHSICLLNVHQKDEADETRNVFSKLNLVDLAGSERADRTGATGARLKEGSNINKSLSTLGSVINGLVEKARGKKVFIPYRDSKLTRVLQESLGGNSLCTMLATLSPAKANAKETLSTLRYAARAKTIKVSVTKNEEASQISLLNEEVAKLKKLLAEKAAESQAAPSGTVDREALKLAEEKLAQQIAETEAMTKQTWTEKQEASKKHEQEIARMKKAHKDAARRADAERKRRFQLLRSKADVELSVKELALPNEWAEHARKIRALEARVKERRAHVGVFLDALASDVRGLRYCEDDASEQTAAKPSLTRATASTRHIESLQHHHTAASALVKKGAAESVEARFGLLAKELDKLETDEAGLSSAADALVSTVEAELKKNSATTADKETAAATPGGDKKATRNRERIKLVLDQCVARRDGLNRDAGKARASVVCSSAVEDTHNRHADFASMARELAAELASVADALKETDFGSDELSIEVSDAEKTLAGKAAQAAEAASRVQSVVRHLEEQTDQVAQRDPTATAGSSLVQAARASSGDHTEASTASSKTDADGWAPDGADSKQSLLFDFGKPSIPSSIVTQPGVVYFSGGSDSEEAGNPGERNKLDGSDRHYTATLLSRIFGWASLRLRVEKAEKLLNRPPVRFLLDVFAALNEAAELGDLMPPTLTAEESESKETRREYFHQLIKAIASNETVKDSVSQVSEDGSLEINGATASPDSILSGQGVDGTNALLQATAIIALEKMPKKATPVEKVKCLTKPTQISVSVLVGDTWKDLGKFPVDPTSGRAVLPSDVPATTQCECRVTDFSWSVSPSSQEEEDKLRPKCRLALQVVESEAPTSPGAPAKEGAATPAEDGVTKEEAEKAVQDLAIALKEAKLAMLAGVAAMVAGTRHVAEAAAAAQKAAAEAERGKAQEMVGQMEELRELAEIAEKARVAADEKAQAALSKVDELKEAARKAEEEAAEARAREKHEAARATKAESAFKETSEQLQKTKERCDELDTQVRESENAAHEAETRLESARAEADKIRASLADAETKLASELEKLASLTAAHDEHAVQIQNLTKELAEHDKSRRDATTALEAKTAALNESEARLKAAHQAAASQVEGQSAEVAELKAALTSAQDSLEKDRQARAAEVAEFEARTSEYRDKLAEKTTEFAEASQALKEAHSRIEDLRSTKDSAEAKLSAATERVEAAETRAEDAKKALTQLKETANVETSQLKDVIKSMQAQIEQRESEGEALEAKHEAENRHIKALEDEVESTRAALEAAKEETKTVQKEVETARVKAHEAAHAARAAVSGAEAATEAAAEAEARAERAEHQLLERDTALESMESDMDALQAQVQSAENDLRLAREATALAESSTQDMASQKEDLVEKLEAAELALRVAEEERDAARDQEISLTNEMETLREDLDNGSEAYVRISERLAEKSDELADTRERLEAFVEAEQRRAHDFLNANANVESEAVRQAAEASKQAQRAYNEAQTATQDADALRGGLKTARDALYKRLSAAGHRVDLPPDRLTQDSTKSLVDAVTTLVAALVDRDLDLTRRIAVAERPPEVGEDTRSGGNPDDYDDDFE